MMTQPKQQSPFKGENIPASLKANARWAPWKQVWNEKRQKFDKIPHQAKAPYYGLSTAKPERWYSYEQALQAFQDNPQLFAGVGYVMTGPHGVVGIDLDGCVHDNVIDDWALEVIKDLASYTELSPSGKGLRILVEGKIASDWTNHEVGIEVYGGNEPRFLTVTGQRLKMSVQEVASPPATVFNALDAQYAKVKSTATIISLHLPELVDELLLPDLAGLGLPYQATDFLTDGTHRGDRSRELFATAVSLYAAGLTDDVVLSILVSNQHAFEVAMDHRRYDHDRALMYLWVEHCQKAKGRATSKTATADDFDVIPGESGPTVPENSKMIAKPLRFEAQLASAFAGGAVPTWTIKGVLPKAELVVLYGESGSGKSFIALDMACSVARGLSWRDRKVSKGKVVYIAAEGAGGFRKRLQAYAKANGIEVSDLDGDLFVINAAPNFIEKADAVEVSKAIAQCGPVALVIVDTWAQVMPGANENSGEDVGRALAHCKGIHKATGGMVMLVHHSGKDTSKGARGWSGLRAAADAEFEVTKLKDGHNLKCTKQKDGETDAVFGFGLTVVPLSVDDDGDPITSCVVTARDVAKVAPKRGPEKNSSGWGLVAVSALEEWFAKSAEAVELKVLAKNMTSCPPEGSDRKDLTSLTRQARKKLREVVLDDDYPYQMDGHEIITLEQ